jgi:hypothetical protein
MLRPVADATCASCGKGLAPNDVLYDAEARTVCGDCASKAEISRDEARSAKNIKRAAFTCLGAGVFAFACFTVLFGLGFWAGAIISVAAGLYAGQSMLTNGERFLKYLSPAEKTAIWVSTIVGLGIAAYETLVIFDIIKFRVYIKF